MHEKKQGEIQAANRLIDSSSLEDLKYYLLTNDGKGIEFKRRALEKLITLIKDDHARLQEPQK